MSKDAHRYITSIIDAIPVSEATDEDVARMLKTMRGGKVGYERHHGILITSWSEPHIRAAHEEALRTFEKCPVSDVTEGVTNDYRSFAIFPDGSKEGWATSDEGDTERARYIEWLRTQEYDDGSSALAWALVQFGDDDLVSKIVCDSDDTWRDALAKQGVKVDATKEATPFPAAIHAVASLAGDSAVARGFYDADTPVPILIALMQSELSGVLTAYRKGSPPSEKIPGFSSTEEKMADLIIRALGMSAARGLRIGEAVLAKMEYNRARPHKHGGKAY